MVVDVRREMSSGMGRGLLESLRDYCMLTGTTDELSRSEYYRVASAVFAEVERLKPDGSKS